MYKKHNAYDLTKESHESMKIKLKTLKHSINKMSCFLGWDGFIDYIYSVVRTREGLNNWTRMESMKAFGELILEVAGSSVGLESVLKRKISGGFTTNTCKGMNSLGVNTFLISAWGYPIVDEIFKPLNSKDSISVKSFINSGRTLSLEFDDGKIMVTDFGDILEINWDLLKERVTIETIIRFIEHSNILGFGYWSIIPQFNDILNNILNDVFPSINNLKDKVCLIDLADTKKRNKADIREMLKILKKVDDQVPLLLSLNDQEAIDISNALDSVKNIDTSKNHFEYYIDGGKKINEDLNLSYLVIHSPHFATISTKNDHYWVTQCFTSAPKFTTSAGDHFNAGCALGLACKLYPPESILMGNALSSIFIRTGNSPTFLSLTHFIHEYMDYIECDNPDFSLNNIK